MLRRQGERSATSGGGSAVGRERHLGTAMVSLAGGEVIGKVATLITMAWAARGLGLEAFGVFTFALGLGLLLASLTSLTTTTRMVQLVGADVGTLGVRLAALTMTRLVSVVPAAALAVPFMLARSEAVDRWTIALMVAAALLDEQIKVRLAACTVLDRQSATAFVLVGQRAMTLALVVVALHLQPSSATVAGAFTIGSFVGYVAMVRLARHYGARAAYAQMQWEHVRELVVAIPVQGGNSVIMAALARVDVILIAALVGDAAVGLYGVAYRLMESALFVSWSLSRALTPDLVRAKLGAELSETVRLGIVLLFALYLPYGAVLAIYGNDLVELIFGQGYDTGSILVVLSACPLIFGLGHFAASALFARSSNPNVPLAAMAALIVNVGLNVLLLPHLQAEGAAIAKTAAFAVQTLIMGWALLRLAPQRGALRGVMVTVVATLVCCLSAFLGLPLVLAVIVAALVYCPVWLVLTRRYDQTTFDWLKRATTPARAGVG